MLGKLIKYDFKALSRFLVVIHIMLLVTAALGRVLVVGRFMQNPDSISNSEMGTVIMTVVIMVYVILFMSALFGTILMLAIHFYKNLYSDEGYLTHTLPVTRGQLLASKTICGSVWMLIDMALVSLSVLILVIYKPFVEQFVAYKDDVLEAMGFPNTVGYGKILFAVFLLSVIYAAENVLMVYMSIALGQLFSNHRVLGSVIVYFSINTIISIISGVVGAAYGISLLGNAVDERFLYIFYYKTYLFSIVLGIAFTAVSYFVTQLLMQKKLNLS